MQNNVLNFIPDQPQVIKLKYRTGKEFRKGEHRGFTYTLVNNLVAFFPPEVDRDIQALHVDAGQPIRITKKSSGAWDIERVAGEPSEVHPQVSCAVDTATNTTGDGAQRHYPNATTNGSAPPMQPAWGMSILRQALFAVIDDAYEAETYAAGKGLAIRFSGEDIRCMANTAVINAAQGRG